MIIVVLIVVGLALIAGLVALVLGAGRRRASAGEPGVDARGVRRFFQYVLLYALLVTFATGAADLLGRLVGDVPTFDDQGFGLAQSLAFVFVGGPLAAALAAWTRRRARRDAAETESTAFAIYVTVAALTAAVVTMVSLQTVLSAAFGLEAIEGGAAGGVVVWGALWLAHWVVARRTLDEERGTPHLVLGSLIGLAVAVTGLVSTLGTALDLLARPGWVIGGPRVLADAAATMVAGGVVWARYWLTGAARAGRGTLWLAYVLLFGVGGGLVLALLAGSALLWSVLVWVVGDRFGGSAALHFDGAAMQLAAVGGGALVWWYHRTVLAEGRRPGRAEVLRVYEYLVSGIGLAAAAAGVGTVLVALIEASTPGLDVGLSVRNTLLAAVTLLAVGLPVWWAFWSRIRSAVAGDQQGESASPTRRVYLVLLFGIAGVAAVIALIAVAFTVFQDAVNGVLSSVTLRSVRYGLGVLVATAAVSAYHGTVLRQDRAIEQPRRPAGPRSVVLVGDAAPDLARAVAEATGARVELWSRTDGVCAAWDADALRAALDGHEGEDLLVVAPGGTPQVAVVDRTGRRRPSASPPADTEPPRMAPDDGR